MTPNILLIMTDQQRADAMGCAGGWVRTPHMDRLAAEGVRFTNCVTTSPVCVPARRSMATGLYCHHTHVWANGRHTLDPATPTWMAAIRDAGYRTSLFGKTHLHPHRGDLRDRVELMHRYGLADVDETPGPRAAAVVRCNMTEQWEQRGVWQAYRDDYEQRFVNKPHVVRPSPLPLDAYYDCYVGARAADYLRAYDRDEPWFCWVSFGGPHEPWDTPEPYASLYDPSAMPLPRAAPRSAAGRPRGVLDDRLGNAPPLTPDEIAAMRADYAGSVTLIDEQVGRLLSVIEARGELANTVIAFTSDHGEMNGDAGLIYKEVFLDGAVRVPMMVRTPATVRSNVAGSVASTFVEWFDIGPTLVDLAGAALTHAQCARSLCPTLEDPALVHRDDAISEYAGEVMLLTDRCEAALNREGELYLLFDREADANEQVNLAGDSRMRDVATSLRLRILERIMASHLA